MKLRTTIHTPHRMLVLSLYTALFIGMLIGSFFCVNTDFNSDSLIFGQNIVPLNISLLESLKRSVCVYMAFLLTFAFLGTFSLGQAAAFVLVAYRGFCAGFALSASYMAVGSNTVLLISTLPKLLAVSVIFILAAREAVRLSNKIFAFLFLNTEKDDMRKNIRLYCIKFAVLTLFSIITAFAENAVYYLFQNFTGGL